MIIRWTAGAVSLASCLWLLLVVVTPTNASLGDRLHDFRECVSVGVVCPVIVSLC